MTRESPAPQTRGRLVQALAIPRDAGRRHVGSHKYVGTSDLADQLAPKYSDTVP